MKYTLDESLATKNDREKYVSKKFINKEGLEYEVLGVHKRNGGNSQYVCIFTESGSEQLSYKSSLIKECVKDNTVDKKIGVEYETNKCGKLITTKRLSGRRFEYRFIDTGTVGNAYLTNIRRGEVEDPYCRKTFGIGFIGDIDISKYRKEHEVWRDMFERVYTDNYSQYEGASIDSEWHNFSVFAKDYRNLLGYKEMIEHPDTRFDLDKDLKASSKIYSKDNCVLIPHTINMAIISKIKTNKTGYPGVSYNSNKNSKYKYQIGCSKNHKRIPLGYTNDLKEGYEIYKEAKLRFLKEKLEEDFPYLNYELKCDIMNGMKRILELIQ